MQVVATLEEDYLQAIGMVVFEENNQVIKIYVVGSQSNFPTILDAIGKLMLVWMEIVFKVWENTTVGNMYIEECIEIFRQSRKY